MSDKQYLKELKEVCDVIKIGKKYKIRYGEDHPLNKTVHILAIVDEDIFVLKWWGRHKKRWFYNVEYYYCFKLLIKDGIINV